jgi:hypothetical protein
MAVFELKDHPVARERVERLAVFQREPLRRLF